MSENTGDGGLELRPEDAAAVSRALLEGTRDDVLVADEAGRVTFVSSRLASLAGIPRQDAVGEPAERILEAIDLPAFSELEAMLSRVSSARTEATLVDRDGVGHPVLLRGVSTPLEERGRRYVWFVTELSRVRSVERANRILKSELETQSRLLALVSHELRTPITVILGQLALLETGLRGELSETQRDAVDRSVRAAQSLLTLINDLIDFARLEADDLELEIVEFPVEDVLSGLREIADTLLDGQGSEVSVRVQDPNGGRALGDPGRTRQILVNLLTNAIKFSDGGEIRVRTRSVELRGEDAERTLLSEGSYLAIDVRDSGSGIPREELGRVFEPFHQVEGLLTRSREGSGLGLAIARRLARRQGGALTADSTPGEGSVFTLHLPRAG